jgi:hypothetical protein
LANQSKADFESLYVELERWKEAQSTKVKAEKRLKDHEKHTVLKSILNTEIEMLQTLDKKNLEAKKVAHEENTNRFFDQIGRPKLWKNSDGKYNSVTTPHTTRAAALSVLFLKLQETKMTIDERLDLLMSVKTVVTERPADITSEIKQLINREADTINRGRPVETLQGLRDRITKLFLSYIQNEEMNPEVGLVRRRKMTQSQKLVPIETKGKVF